MNGSPAFRLCNNRVSSVWHFQVNRGGGFLRVSEPPWRIGILHRANFGRSASGLLPICREAPSEHTVVEPRETAVRWLDADSPQLPKQAEDMTSV